MNERLSTFEFSRRHLGGAWLTLPGAELPTLLVQGRVVVGAVGTIDPSANPWGPWIWAVGARRFGVEDSYVEARCAAEKVANR